MLRGVALVIALASCSPQKRSPPLETAARYPIVPETVMLGLGDIGFALALDLHSPNLNAVATMIPEPFACARDIARSATLAVITAGLPDTWEARVQGVAETSSRDCLSTIAAGLGISVTAAGEHRTIVNAPAKAFSVMWNHGDIVIAEKDAPVRSGAPPGVITDLLASVPHNVQGWLVTSGMPNFKIKSVVAWLEATPTTWKVTTLAESTEIGAARPWIESIVAGFSAAAAANQIAVKPTWFAIASTPTTATLNATIPLAAFVPGAGE